MGAGGWGEVDLMDLVHHCFRRSSLGLMRHLFSRAFQFLLRMASCLKRAICIHSVYRGVGVGGGDPPGHGLTVWVSVGGVWSSKVFFCFCIRWRYDLRSAKQLILWSLEQGRGSKDVSNAVGVLNFYCVHENMRMEGTAARSSSHRWYNFVIVSSFAKQAERTSWLLLLCLLLEHVAPAVNEIFIIYYNNCLNKRCITRVRGNVSRWTQSAIKCYVLICV